MRSPALEAARFVLANDPTPEDIVVADDAIMTAEGFAPLVPFNAPVVLDPFPTEALPRPISDFVEDVARSVQVPAVVPALLSVATAAAAVAGKYRVEIGTSHSEPLNLFVAALMDPGARKSETFARVTAPLEDLEEELVAAKRPEIDRLTQRRAIEEERLKALRARAAKADDDDDREETIQQAEELAAKLTEVPALPRLIVGDETPEHLGKELAEQGGRIFLADADAALFDVLGGRYNDKPNIELFLKGHAGDRVRVGRNSRGFTHIERPALTIAIAAQPAALTGIARDGTLRGRGLLGRFLWAFPVSLVGSRLYSNVPPDAGAAERYAAVVRALYRLTATSADGEIPTFHISGAALTAWTAFHDELEMRQGDGGDLSQARDWASKAAGAAARVAGVFHAVRHAHGLPTERPVSEEDALAAIAVVRALIPHALAVLAAAGADERLELARRILGWAERSRERMKVDDRMRTFSLRDVHRIFPAYGRAEELLPALEVAEARGYIKALPAPERTGPGRSPSPRFALRPPLEALLTESTERGPAA